MSPESNETRGQKVVVLDVLGKIEASLVILSTASMFSGHKTRKSKSTVDFPAMFD